MLTKKSLVQRASLLLLVIFFLGAVFWLDTLDLTDDIPLSQVLTFEQQVIESDEDQEHLLGFVHGVLGACSDPLVDSPPQSLACSSACCVSAQAYRPLYQRHCTYRI